MSEVDEVIEEAIQTVLARMQEDGGAYYDEEIGDWRLRDTERFKEEVRAETFAIMRRRREGWVRAEIITFGNRRPRQEQGDEER